MLLVLLSWSHSPVASDPTPVPVDQMMAGPKCELPPPGMTFCTNGGTAIGWTPVVGAIGYTIEFKTNASGCGCRGGSQKTIYVDVGQVNSYTFGSLPGNCFSYRVASICPDEAGGVFSPAKCYKAGFTPCF